MICSVQHWGEMPGPHFSLFMAYMHLTQDHRVDSTLALPWERRSALEQQISGVQAVCVAPISSPLLRKSCTWSVLDDVMFPSLFWWGDHGSCNHLVLLQDFAITRAWYSVLRDTTKPAYHSKNPWQQVVLSWPNASLSATAWCCKFLSSIAQEHLPWFIFHAALSLFFLWANHDTSEPLTYSVLP